MNWQGTRVTDLERTLEVVLGYLDLGMSQDAWDELETLPANIRDSQIVVEHRIVIHQRLMEWRAARILAETLTRKVPAHPGFWILWAHSLRFEQSVEAAREVLRVAFELHPDFARIIYALACYTCALGETKEAVKLLHRAFELDKELWVLAHSETDLRQLFQLRYLSAQS